MENPINYTNSLEALYASGSKVTKELMAYVYRGYDDSHEGVGFDEYEEGDRLLKKI